MGEVPEAVTAPSADAPEKQQWPFGQRGQQQRGTWKSWCKSGREKPYVAVHLKEKKREERKGYPGHAPAWRGLCPSSSWRAIHQC